MSIPLDDDWNNIRSKSTHANKYKIALEKLISILDSCPQFESGAGGMSIESQIRRTFINRVPAIAVEEARDVLLDIDE